MFVVACCRADENNCDSKGDTDEDGILLAVVGAGTVVELGGGRKVHVFEKGICLVVGYGDVVGCDFVVYDVENGVFLLIIVENGSSSDGRIAVIFERRICLVGYGDIVS